jgi:hypothetical protein
VSVTDQPAPRGAGWSSRSGDEEGWSPATPVRAGNWHGSQSPPRNVVKPPKQRPAEPPPESPFTPREPSEWAPGGPVPRRRTSDGRSARSGYPWAAAPAKERGLPWWAALLLLIVIAALGGLIDALSSSSTRSGFNIGIVVASVVAILVVRRSHMFPIVIAPPIVYSAAAVLELYLRSGGLSDKRAVFDAAANYLVYGFPAIAAATAGVLIFAGIRLIARR